MITTSPSLPRSAIVHGCPHRDLWPTTTVVNAGGRLAIGGRDLAGLADEHGTSLYVFDGAGLTQVAAAVADAYAGTSTVCYAARASSPPWLLASCGLRLDVVSGDELQSAVADLGHRSTRRVHK